MARLKRVPTAGSTTNIFQLKKGSPFTWGLLLKIHEVGPYVIVKYHPWKSKGVSVLTGYPDYDRTSYHVDEGGRGGYSSDDLDVALAHAIAVRSDGINTRADRYFIRSIKTPEGNTWNTWNV